jgi:hypothetical protein
MHALTPYRDDINSLIGPLEELNAKLEGICDRAKVVGLAANTLFFIGLGNSIAELSDLVAAIDDQADEPDEADEPFVDPHLAADEAAEDEEDEDEDE